MISLTGLPLALLSSRARAAHTHVGGRGAPALSTGCACALTPWFTCVRAPSFDGHVRQARGQGAAGLRVCGRRPHVDAQVRALSPGALWPDALYANARARACAWFLQRHPAAMSRCVRCKAHPARCRATNARRSGKAPDARPATGTRASIRCTPLRRGSRLALWALQPALFWARSCSKWAWSRWSPPAPATAPLSLPPLPVAPSLAPALSSA